MSDQNPHQPYQQGPPDQSAPNQPYGQEPAPQQSYGQAPQGYGQPPAPVAGGDFPGKTLGIVGLVLSFFTALIGMIISIVALRQSKKAGFKNTPAVIGIVIGVLATLAYLVVIGITVAGVLAFSQKCAELGPGTHTEGGVTYTCPGTR